MDGDEPAVQIEAAALAWPGETTLEDVSSSDPESSEDTGLWSKSRDFDWGD
jgi:hypothetical protein